MILRSRNPALEAQYKEQGECCYYFKRQIPFGLITRDHILPHSKGGRFVNNKIFAFRFCNNIKGNLTFEKFKKRLEIKSDILDRKIRSEGLLASTNDIYLLESYKTVINTIDEIICNDFRLNISFT
jgi:hypothetical protein